jgi:hypothetical protein
VKTFLLLFLLLTSIAQAENLPLKIGVTIFASETLNRPDLVKKQFRRAARHIASKINVKLYIVDTVYNVSNPEEKNTPENSISWGVVSWKNWYKNSPYFYTGTEQRYNLFLGESPTIPFVDGNRYPRFSGGTYLCAQRLSPEYRIAFAAVSSSPYDMLYRSKRTSFIVSSLIIEHELLHIIGASHNEVVRPNVMQPYFIPWIGNKTENLKIPRSAINQVRNCLNIKAKKRS